jgi:DNA polymerase-3 subunit delta
MPRTPRSGDAGRPDVLPAFLLYGEDRFQAREFLAGLRKALSPPGEEPPSLEKFSPEDTPWRDILDIARMVPFAFSPWRILVVEAEKQTAGLSEAEAEVLREYLADPTSRTTFVVLVEGTILKSSALAKAFASAPPSSAQVLEFGPLKGPRLKAWARAKFEELGCRVAPSAVGLVVERAGNDLGRIGREAEKLAAYVGEARFVSLEDVEDLAGGIRTSAGWELQAALEETDAEKALSVLNRMFASDKEKAPFYALGILSGFFRDLLRARSEADASKRSREEIFTDLKPRLVNAWKSFPTEKCRDFFALAFRPDLRRFIESLERIDLRLKRSETSAPRELFEALVWDFCRPRAARATSSGRGSSFRPGG